MPALSACSSTNVYPASPAAEIKTCFSLSSPCCNASADTHIRWLRGCSLCNCCILLSCSACSVHHIPVRSLPHHSSVQPPAPTAVQSRRVATASCMRQGTHHGAERSPLVHFSHVSHAVSQGSPQASYVTTTCSVTGPSRSNTLHGKSGHTAPKAPRSPNILYPAPLTRVTHRTQQIHEVAEETRRKLAERGEKLKQLDESTNALEEGAMGFAEMAKQLRAQQEKRGGKWW